MQYDVVMMETGDRAECQAINARIADAMGGQLLDGAPDFCEDADAALEALHHVRGEGVVELGTDGGGWFCRIRGPELEIWVEARAPTEAMATSRAVAAALDRVG